MLTPEQNNAQEKEANAKEESNSAADTADTQAEEKSILMKVLFEQLDYLDPKLKGILLWLEELFQVEFNNTSHFRPDDDGVHGYGRGWDIQCNYTPFGKLVAQTVNSAYEYDPTRPNMNCAVYGDDNHRNHIHLQVHPNTRLR